MLIVGLGDLGTRISQALAERGPVGEMKLASRGEAAAQWAHMLTFGTKARVSNERLDGRDQDGMKRLLTEFAPDLIVQCASLLSPWALPECGTPPALAIAQAGLALQISAQLPIIHTVMRAHAELGMSCPVVNCSFPDLTHPILAGTHQAPTSGVGNVAMIACYIEAELRSRRTVPDDARIRVVAHHAQVMPFLTGKPETQKVPFPMVACDGRLLSAAELQFFPGLIGGRHFNYLTAVTAVPLIAALLDDSITLHTHAPGVLGLPGGYPIAIQDRKVKLELPTTISQEQAIAFNNRCGSADGVERIEPDGTLIYTEQAIQIAKPYCPELTAPLSLANYDARLATLLQFCRDCANVRNQAARNERTHYS